MSQFDLGGVCEGVAAGRKYSRISLSSCLLYGFFFLVRFFFAGVLVVLFGRRRVSGVGVAVGVAFGVAAGGWLGGAPGVTAGLGDARGVS